MAIEVKLPLLGQTMKAGTILSFMVKLGDEVKKTDTIFEIETDKVTLEIESPADGFVKNILVAPGQTINVGQTVLLLGEKEENIPRALIDSLKADLPADTIKAGAEAMPPARTTAADLKTPSAAPEKIKLGDTIPLSRLQKITGQKMLQSKQQIPSFYMNAKADVTELAELRNKINQKADTKISYNDFIMRALATALKKFPFMTGQLSDENIELADTISIGLAVFTGQGLVVPVVKSVEKKDINTIARDSTRLIEKARNNKLKLTDLEDACITISNLGSFGTDNFIPVVVPGQCSILGVGRIADTCVPDNGNIVVRKLMSLTLSVDHKVANGAYAAQFLDFLKKLLEDTSNFT